MFFYFVIYTCTMQTCLMVQSLFCCSFQLNSFQCKQRKLRMEMGTCLRDNKTKSRKQQYKSHRLILLNCKQTKNHRICKTNRQSNTIPLKIPITPNLSYAQAKIMNTCKKNRTLQFIYLKKHCRNWQIGLQKLKHFLRAIVQYYFQLKQTY